MTRTIRTRWALLASTGFALIGSAATAQTVVPNTGLDATNQSPPPVADTAADATDIVVTGSLIQRPNNVSVSPVISLSSEAVKQSGAVSLEEALNQLPSFTPAGGAATGGQGAGARATVNLHGLGSNRNLVLLDGKRLPLSDINGNVDINILPAAIIGDIDVITGGASAIYGSDAISGVVNFKTVGWFDGLRADGQIGNSFRGDYREVDASLAGGTSFAGGRGHVIATVSYSDRQPLLGSKRSFFDQRVPSSFIGQSTFVPDALNLPSQAVLNGLFAGYGGSAPVGRTLNLGFNDDATLFTQTGARNYRGPTDGGYAIIGNNVRMPVGPQLQLLNGLERKAAFVKGDFELTEGLTLYGQAMYVDSKSLTASGRSLTQFGALTSIPVTNPFIPTDLRTLLASRPNPAARFTWNGRYIGVGDKTFEENYKVQQYIGGIKGDIAGSWKFDAYAAYDHTAHDQYNRNAVLKSRVQDLLNAPDGGASLCPGGFNPFGAANAASLSSACQDYVTKTAFSTERLSQTQAQATVQGPLFTLPGGDVQLAILAGYRKNTYNYRPDADLAAQNIEAVIASAAASGRVNVKEVAAQIDVPLLKDRPFFRELGIGGAVRYSDYSITGGVVSYEGDARWRPVDMLLVRGSYQRAVRAPNIGELFSPQSGVQIAIGTPPASIGDPCDIRSTARTGANGAAVRALCVAQGIPLAAVDSYQFPTTATAGVVSGNTELTPEKATTWNAGFILNPKLASPWLHDFSLSVDYYNISIRDVISTVPGLTSLAKCYNLDGTNPTLSADNDFCRLLARDAQGNLSTIGQPFLNLGGLKTDGVEIQVSAGVRLSEIGIGNGSGRVYGSSAINWTNSFDIQTLPNTPFQNFAGTNTIGSPRPSWKALTTLGYRSDVFGFGARWRFQAAMDDITAVTTPATPAPGVPAYNLYDLFATLRVNEQFELRAGITNLADAKIPVVSSSQNGADPGTFDIVGRSFYVGVKAGF